MLNNEIVNNDLYKEVSAIAEQMDLSIVDVSKTVHNSDIHISITVYSSSKETGIDDCEHFHRTIQPRLELKYGRDNLSMEVATPGIQRLFKDCHEFSVFTGKKVRVYVLSLSSYVIGMISDTDDKSVTLSDVHIEDNNKDLNELIIEFKDIQKAKLEYVFASKKEKHNV